MSGDSRNELFHGFCFSPIWVAASSSGPRAGDQDSSSSADLQHFDQISPALRFYKAGLLGRSRTPGHLDALHNSSVRLRSSRPKSSPDPDVVRSAKGETSYRARSV